MQHNPSVNQKQYSIRAGRRLAAPLLAALLTALLLAGVAWASGNVITIDTGGLLSDAGAASAVALKSDGLAVMVYWDKTAGNAGNVKVAFCNDAVCSSPTTYTIDQALAAQAMSVALTSGDVPVISYPGTTGMTVAICNSATACDSPTIKTIENTGNLLGEYSSLAVNSSNYPVVAYSENIVSGSDNLRVAYCQDAGCSAATTRVVDNGDGTIEDLSLVLNSGDVPLISYGDGGTLPITPSLKIAICDGSTDCSSPTINTIEQSARYVGRYNSLALNNSSGFPVLSYYVQNGGSLEMAFCSDTTCSSPAITTTLDSVGNVGGYTSLALDSNGYPVVSYVDFTNTALKLAVCDDSTCSSPWLRTLDNSAAVGQFSSLALTNPGDYPVVSFYDRTNKDFKLYLESCASNSWSAADETGLNDAIDCYNGKTTAGVYTITLTSDIDLSASSTTIDNATSGASLTIMGQGNGVSGSDLSGVRPFYIAADTVVTMTDIVVSNGNVSGINTGGGIRNEGTLTLINSEVLNNQAELAAGGITNFGSLTIRNSNISGNATTAADAGGGGISNTGVLQIENSTISDNRSHIGAGIQNSNGSVILDSVTIAANTVYTNAGVSGLGAGIMTRLKPVVVKNSILADNSGAADCDLELGGSITDNGYNLVETPGTCTFTGTGTITGQDPVLGPLADNGGDTWTHALLSGSPAIDAGATSLPTDQRGVDRNIYGTAPDIGAYESGCAATSWTVASEAALNAAIACFNAKTTPNTYVITLTDDIDLMASTTTISNTTDRVKLRIDGDYTWAVSGGNRSGVRPFHVAADTDVTMNQMFVYGGNVTNGNGGGILNEGTLTLNQVFVEDNRANGGFDTGMGGGIYNIGSLALNNSEINANTASNIGGGLANLGSLTLNNSTLSNNSAGGQGGGLFNGRILVVGNGTATIHNSTISGNATSSEGGGIYANRGTTLDSVTVYSNTTTGTNGPGVFIAGDATLNITNTILAGNTGGSGYDCDRVGSGSAIDGGHNLVQTQSGCGLTPVSTADPLLGPLADNGGDTRTHDLLATSPALNAGATSLTTDQRGVTRPYGTTSDIGAVEHYGCAEDNWTVATEGDLNAAIACFNTKTVAASHTITLTANINLVTSTLTIDNITATLVITGDYVVSGQDQTGVRPFHIAANTTVYMGNLTITAGNAEGLPDGGGIRNEGNLTLNRVNVTASTADGAGGIYNSGDMMINNSNVSYNESAYVTGAGGGIVNEGTMTMNNSVVGTNLAYAGAGVSNVGSLTINNSTIAKNSGNRAAGISNVGGTLTLDSVTVADNTVTDFAAGLYTLFTAPTIRNTILADNTGGDDCEIGPGTPAVTDGGNNLVINQTGCGITSVSTDDPKLGPLQDNGGDTFTIALLPTSPALDAGSTTLLTDQRGITRTFGAPDIGAYESTCGAATSWEASTEDELDQAIGCFNKQTVAGSYTITVTDNISVTGTAIARIDNPTSGPSLVIEGGDHTLNGGETFTFGGSELGNVGFEITSATPVTINDLTLTRFRSLLSGPAVKNAGGGPLTLNNVSLIENVAGFGGGGAVTASGPVTVTNSLVTGNVTTVGDGGAIIVQAGGSLTVLDSEFSDNSATRHGGAIAAVTGALGVNITNSILDANSAAGDGGAIYQLAGTMTISASTLSDNSAEYGGGIKTLGNLSIAATEIAFNTANAGGGGLDSEGFLNAYAVTFNNNSAGKSGGSKGTGGGFQSNAGNARIENSTFNGNRAFGGKDDGGGAIMVYGGSVLLDSVTIGGNSSATKGGGIAVYGGIVTQDAPAPQLTMGNTIVSDNSASVSGPDLSGIVTSADYNLVKDVSGATFTAQAHDITGQSAQLDPLADNGGATWTMALADTSPAIDNGSTSLTVDQRGAARPQGLADDIGAYEAAARLGTIIIRKSTAPVGAGGAGFNFNTSAFGNFTLKDGGKQTIHNVAAGVYTVTETALPTGYELSGISCVDSVTSGVSSTGDVASKTATINLEAGEIVTCRFVNAVNDSLTVEKITIPAGSTSFSYTSNGSGNPPASFSVTAGQVQVFTSVLPQTYVLTEAVQKGYELTSLSCTSADGGTATGDPTTGSVSVTVAAGDQWHCTSVSTAGGDIYLPIISKNSN